MEQTADGQDETVRREKAALRAQFRRFRQEMPEEEWAARSRTIAERLAALPEALQAQVVHAYWPSIARREVDLRPLLHAWHAEGKTVVLPRIDSATPPQLTHHVWHPEAAFLQNVWLLDEPDAAWAVFSDPPDLILVPALAVDERGYRLGYGKGFYDAFLAATPALFVAPLFDACVAKTLPHETHDVPVHALVTETRVLRTA